MAGRSRTHLHLRRHAGGHARHQDRQAAPEYRLRPLGDVTGLCGADANTEHAHAPRARSRPGLPLAYRSGEHDGNAKPSTKPHEASHRRSHPDARTFGDGAFGRAGDLGRRPLRLRRQHGHLARTRGQPPFTCRSFTKVLTSTSAMSTRCKAMAKSPARESRPPRT